MMDNKLDNENENDSTGSGPDEQAPAAGGASSRPTTWDGYVLKSKSAAFIILAMSAIGLGFMAYYLTRSEELDDFGDQFADFATELIDLSDNNIHVTADVLKNAAVAATSMALATQQEWPFVTMSHFAERQDGVRGLARFPFLALAPLVTDRFSWESYASQSQAWVNEGFAYQGTGPAVNSAPFSIHGDFTGTPLDVETPAPFSPVWQVSPVPDDLSVVNLDLFHSDETISNLLLYTDTNRIAGISQVVSVADVFGGSAPAVGGTPHSIMVQPIYKDLSDTSVLVAHYIALISWETYFEGILHEGADGIVAVLSNSCGQSYSFEIDGSDAAFIGVGDHHDTGYDSHEKSQQLFDPGQAIVDSELENNHCFYTLHVYPSDTLKGHYTSNGPFLYTVIVVAVMLATGIAFYGYELLVQRRQKIVLDKVERTTAIVTSLFPDTVRDRILNDEEPFNTRNKKDNTMLGKQGLKYFLDENAGELADYAVESKPIADLFPHTTVMFADISGFTAWSSVREPAQVFTLLETIYQSFDKIARKRRVFKVETVGDCYVAVCGLPEPRKDHAVVMALFARDCMKKMGELVKQLELTLGPDTGDLANRFGLHSGACTAGVLRGERARFQLFGDTVNTAARMESTGQRNKIHVSQETADLIISAGKKHWLEERRDIIVAKGKGALQTYWLNPNDEEQDTVTVEQGEELVAKVAAPTVDEVAKKQASVANQKLQRLIDWNCELLTQNLKKIMARRQAEQKVTRSSVTSRQSMAAVVFGKESDLCTPGNCLSEIVEIIRLPQFKSSGDAVDPKAIQLNETVQGQLRDFCSILASLYKDNQFHCFEHASHVTMSVSKLLSRIVAPDVPEDQDADNMDAALHDYTYGITSDPLTHFAVVLAALIHDVDHRGVPNHVLAKEDPNLATVYRDKSIAEQNSVDLAWNALMDPSFSELRSCIYQSSDELARFRKLLVNSVMATDIFDKELGVLRKNRWEKAFNAQIEESTGDMRDRKATIVIEHLIQASDVSHTMQHWHIYRKWNKRLFEEMYEAYASGRTDNDPSHGWYKGELWFFDNYIIPLANKLKDCGVFGVSSDEYLGYATNNRKEWEKKGKEIVAEWIEARKAANESD